MTPFRDRHPAGCAVPLLAALLLVAAPRAQDAEPPQDPELPRLLAELKTLVGDAKMQNDFQAIGLIQKLSQGADRKHPKDRQRLAKGLGDVFRTGKARPADKDILYRETGDALALLAEDGAKELVKALDNKRVDDNLPLQAHLLLALGRTRDEKQVDRLTDIATRSPHDELRAAAGEALGNYTALDVGPRRAVVKALIREWGAIHQLATALERTDPGAPIDLNIETARRRLRAIEGKWNGTLQKLTGVSHSEFTEWQRWLNKNPDWTPPRGR